MPLPLCLSRLPSIKPFSQQSYAMQASGPAPITGGSLSVAPAVLTEGCHAGKVMRQPGSWWGASPRSSEKYPGLPLHFPSCTSSQTLTHSLASRLQVTKAQQGCPCLPVPLLGRAEVLPAPSCECWSSLPSWNNLRTLRLWVDKTGSNFVPSKSVSHLHVLVTSPKTHLIHICAFFSFFFYTRLLCLLVATWPNQAITLS